MSRTYDLIIDSLNEIVSDIEQTGGENLIRSNPAKIEHGKADSASKKTQKFSPSQVFALPGFTGKVPVAV